MFQLQKQHLIHQEEKKAKYLITALKKWQIQRETKPAKHQAFSRCNDPTKKKKTKQNRKTCKNAKEAPTTHNLTSATS